MNVYETIVVFDANLSDDSTAEAIEKVKGAIASGGGEVHKVEPWGRRKLAYEINKHARGYYALFLYSAPSALNKSLEGLFKVFDPVIKYMIVRLEKKQREHALAALAAPAAPAAPAAAPAAPQAAPPAAEASEGV
jgi:small subunit ribosomal protein S6